MQMSWIRRVARVLLVSMSVASLPLPVSAAEIPTDEVLAPAAASVERDAVATFMARDDVARQMGALGVDATQARERVAALSDNEVHQIYGHIQTLPAAGTDLLGTLVFIFIVLLVTDILGLTKVFPFTRSVRR